MAQEHKSEWILVSEETSPSGPNVWKLVAVGDFCPIYKKPGGQSFFSEELSKIIMSCSLAIVNLEGPIRGSGERLLKSGPNLEVDKDTVFHLKQTGFNVVTLANNHIMDWRKPALYRTINEIEKAGLQYCGVGNNLSQALRPAKLSIGNKVHVSVFSLAEKYFGVAEEDRPGFAWIGTPEVLPAIEEAKKSGDVVLVCFHGGIEEVPLPPLQLQQQLRRLVDFGADLVIGAHPHVPQGWERWKNGVIFYSLGNFYFDWRNGARYPKTEVSLGIQATFSGKTLAGVRVFPLEQINRQVKLLSENRGRDVAACFNYLNILTEIMKDEKNMKQYWQELAVWLFYKRYKGYLLGLNSLVRQPQHHSSLQRITQTNEHLKQLLSLWMHPKALQLALSLKKRCGILKKHNKQKDVLDSTTIEQMCRLSGLTLKSVLPALCVIRVESDRWTIETALSVLTGDVEDMRSYDSFKFMNELLRRTTAEIEPEYIPFLA